MSILKKLANDLGGKIDEVGVLPDGSGFATMSMPLPKDHWLLADGHNVPPAPFKIGLVSQPVLNRTRDMWAEDIRKAARYAIRASTDNGKIVDFDPDAMVQNFVVGLIGYWTDDGDSKL